MSIGYVAINKYTKERVEYFTEIGNGEKWVWDNLTNPYHWLYKPNGKFKH